jgi:hypothetical protein
VRHRGEFALDGGGDVGDKDGVEQVDCVIMLAEANAQGAAANRVRSHGAVGQLEVVQAGDIEPDDGAGRASLVAVEYGVIDHKIATGAGDGAAVV